MVGRSIPLPLRLVAIYTVLVTATLLIVGAIVAYLTRSHLERELQQRVVTVTRSFAGGPAVVAGDRSSLPNAARDWLATTAFTRDDVVAVRVGGGRVLTAAGNLDLADLGISRRILLSTESRWWEVAGPSMSGSALTVPIRDRGRQVGTLVVAASDARIGSTLDAVLRGIAIAAAAGLAFAALLGWITVRRTLRPLRRVSAEAAAIEATADVSRRVGYEGPADEVGTLAATFDAMLGRLQDSFDSQRKFLSDASHELRTPLTVVRGQLELLQRELTDPSDRQALRIGIEEVDRMSRIVENLLLLARLDEGIPLKQDAIEVELVVQEAVLRGMLIASRDVTVDVEPGLSVTGDPDRLLQVLTNLITNAIHHAGDDARLRIVARRTGTTVAIEVSDTGVGIPPEDIDRVFERLYRGSRPQTSVPAGAGLGLAIASSLTKAMGGDIRVASTPGVGTTFTITMPAPVARVGREAQTLK